METEKTEKIKTYLPIELNMTEKQDMIDLAKTNPSFYNVWKNQLDITEYIFKEWKNTINGRFPKSLVLSVHPLLGLQTGVFKSALSCQIAKFLDDSFNYEERVGFTPNDLLEKIKKYAKRKQVFVLDERIKDFKMSGELRLANIIEATRERQLSFILAGVGMNHLTFSDYQLERMGESSDEYLNKTVMVNGETQVTGRKTVYYLVKKVTQGRNIYRGYIKWNITSLEDQKWHEFWEGYMIQKRIHQNRAVEQNLSGFDFKKVARELMEKEEFANCYDQNGRLIRGMLKNFIYAEMPDVTRQEKDMIYNQILHGFKEPE